MSQPRFCVTCFQPFCTNGGARLKACSMACRPGRWSETAKDLLIRMRAEGRPVKAIALAVGKPLGGVACKTHELMDQGIIAPRYSVRQDGGVLSSAAYDTFAGLIGAAVPALGPSRRWL